MKPLYRTLIVALTTLCAANILAGLAPVKIGLTEWLTAIRQTTGTAQNWSMFHSIPRVQSMQVRVVASDREGNQHEFDSGLPGLQEIEPHNKIRYYYTFDRIFSPGGEPYRKSYIRNLSQALGEKNLDLVAFNIHLRVENTHPHNTPQKISRLLERIRKSGKAAIEQKDVFGPFPVTSNGPS